MRYRAVLPTSAALVGLIALACSSGSGEPESDQSVTLRPTTEPTATAAATLLVGPTAEATPLAEPTVVTPPPVEPTVGAPPTPPVEPTARPTPTPAPEKPQVTADGPQFPRYMTFGWKTDFSKFSVPIDEIRSGGVGRDGIPPIDDPEFAKVSDPPCYMVDVEPVISLEINGHARAYPLSILIGHEIVNDEVGGVPVTVTYCPLCNTAIVFDRRVNGEILDFGVSGNLRNSDLVMWDRQTQSWWQQITGDAIVGDLTGTQLEFIPAPVITWAQFAEAFPEGEVLTRPTWSFRNYDLPPYSGYDTLGSHPFLFRGEVDPRLDAVERVVAVSVDGEHVAYPFLLLDEHPVINDTVNGQDLVVFYIGGTLSPFGGRGRTPNRVIGSTAVYDPVVDGQKLTFNGRDGVIKDEETGSTWDILGNAVDGPLQGKRLEPVQHGNHFWFSWAAFNPETAVRSAEDLTG